MSTPESDKLVAGKTFPIDLVSRPMGAKLADALGVVKVTPAPSSSFHAIGQPQIRFLAQIPSLGQNASGQLLSTIVPQTVLKTAVDASGRTQISTIPSRAPAPTQVVGRPVASTTYHVPRGAAAVANISGPRGTLISPLRTTSQAQPASAAVTVTGLGSSGNNLNASSTSTSLISSGTVGLPVTGFVRSTGAPRAPNPATATAWIAGNTVQVQTVQVSNPQRLQTFTTLGRPTQVGQGTARPTLIHQGAQIHTFKPATSGPVGSVPVTMLSARTPQGPTLVYTTGANQFTTAPRLAVNSVAQRIGQPRHVQVTGTRARLTVPAAGTRIATGQPITLQASGSQNPNSVTYKGAINSVGIARPIQGQILASGARLTTANIANVNPGIANVVASSSGNTNSIMHTNINASNTTLPGTNIGNLLSMHPILVASGVPRPANPPKIIAQITQQANNKPNMPSTFNTMTVSNTNSSLPQTSIGLISNPNSTRPVSIVSAAAASRVIAAGASKVFPSSSEGGPNMFIHRASPGLANHTECKQPGTFPLAGTQYYYESPAFTSTGTYSSVTPTTHAVHVSQPVRFNPIMLIESNNTQQTQAETVTKSQVISTHSLLSANTSKLASSPRPSILRKRDHEGSPLKAAKNLSPALGVMGPQVSRPPRPESQECPSSGGSTTMSATSSPGLDDDMVEDSEKRTPNDDIPKYSNERYDMLKFSGLNEENLRKFNLEEGKYSREEKINAFENRKYVTEENPHREHVRQGIKTNKDYNVLENRYKHEVKNDDKRLVLSLIEGDALKTCDVPKMEDVKVIKHEDNRPMEMSPRKKPRKQQLTSNELMPKCQSEEMQFLSDKQHKDERQTRSKSTSPDRPKEVMVRKPPLPSLLSGYRQNWKSTHNHFQRYSDVKPKDERRPTIMDLANQSMVLQKINGWKIYHLSTQMEDSSEMETEVYRKLSSHLELMERLDAKDTQKDVDRVKELIKGNMQRSKIINDGMLEAKVQLMRIFDHKTNVSDIIHRSSSCTVHTVINDMMKFHVILEQAQLAPIWKIQQIGKYIKLLTQREEETHAQLSRLLRLTLNQDSKDNTRKGLDKVKHLMKMNLWRCEMIQCTLRRSRTEAKRIVAHQVNLMHIVAHYKLNVELPDRLERQKTV